MIFDPSSVKNLLSQHGSWRAAKTELKKAGIELTAQEAYDIVHDVVEADRIAPCGKTKTFTKFTIGYQYCGSVSRCDCAREAALVGRTATNIDRYGAKSALANKDVRDKRAATMIDRFGTEHALQSADVRAKWMETNRRVYGTDYGLNNPEVRDKIIESHKASDQKAALSKRQATNVERHGVDHPALLPKFKDKARETFIDRYGDHSSRLPENRARAAATMQQLYERDHFSQQHIAAESLAKLTNASLLRTMIDNMSISTIAEHLGVNATTVQRYAKQANIVLPKSSYEGEIAAFLNSLNLTYTTNDRRVIAPMEVDFYIPSARLAIEFNGVFWHSSRHKHPNYHRDKMLAAEARGIRLLMINEDEWLLRGEIVRNRIANILGFSKRGVGARQLTIAKIDALVANAFIDRHHIQGATGSILAAYGATSNDEMVGVMAFNRQRGTQAVELVRFCSGDRIHAGMFSRMFKYAVANEGYDDVLSFADLRYSIGHLYERCGFVLEQTIPPDYRYVVRDRTYHKSTFTKKAIARKYGLDMTNMTERQAMEQLGIPRIYDCGKLRYRWKAKK